MSEAPASVLEHHFHCENNQFLTRNPLFQHLSNIVVFVRMYKTPRFVYVYVIYHIKLPLV